MSGKQAKRVAKKAREVAVKSIRAVLRPKPWFVPAFVWRALRWIVFQPGQ